VCSYALCVTVVEFNEDRWAPSTILFSLFRAAHLYALTLETVVDQVRLVGKGDDVRLTMRAGAQRLPFVLQWPCVSHAINPEPSSKCLHQS
jgi:hypothetical protein